jgi:hypothetical protein
MSAKRRAKNGAVDSTMMFRLEPGGEMRFLLASDFAEADEGLHPVLVALHGFCHRCEPRDIGIGGN